MYLFAVFFFLSTHKQVVSEKNIIDISKDQRSYISYIPIILFNYQSIPLNYC